MDEMIKDLHRDLARKFQQHGSRIEQIWRSLNQKQRENVMRDGAAHGIVLKTPSDTSLGNVYKIVPEWNLRDVTSPSSEFFLDMLKHRATTSLQTQYMSGVNGGPGDHGHIVDMMQKKNLQLTNASELKGCWTLFIAEENYGESIEFTSRTSKKEKEEILTNMMPAMQACLVIPRATGDLVLMRQENILQCLNVAIGDILDTVSTTRTQKKRLKKPANPATAALAELSLHSPPKKLELSDLVDSSSEQKSATEDYINLISTEPTVLAHEVNFWFFTRPELVADEKGRSLPVHTDKYISGAVFDAVHGAVRTAAVWGYITRLLALLKDSPDKQFRAIVLQELSNICHLEYTRAQTMFKRSVSMCSGGSKWFQRSSKQKDGVARISMKRNPESLTIVDPQLHYVLRLCQDETTWSKAAQWIQKLEDLHRAHPLEKDKMSDRESDALGDMAVIVTFIQSLSSMVQLPTLNRKMGQSFVAGYTALENELRQLKTEVDLSDYVIPIDNLLEPGMAAGALTKLDEYFLQKTGTKLGFLYQDLVDESVFGIHKRYAQQKSKTGDVKTEHTATALEAPEAPESRIQQRRQKEKTRPAHSSIYEISPQAASVASPDEQAAQPPQTFQVKASTFAVFSSLLSRSSAARGSVSWDAFAAAMVDLGFSVVPKAGSIYTFAPPEDMAVQRHLTLHRPHRSCIEGPRLLVYSRRLKRVYGWDESTFIVV